MNAQDKPRSAKGGGCAVTGAITLFIGVAVIALVTLFQKPSSPSSTSEATRSAADINPHGKPFQMSNGGGSDSFAATGSPSCRGASLTCSSLLASGGAAGADFFDSDSFASMSSQYPENVSASFVSSLAGEVIT